MADSNKHLAGRIPATPYPALRQLDRLVGAWEASGPFLTGTIRFANRALVRRRGLGCHAVGHVASGRPLFDS